MIVTFHRDGADDLVWPSFKPGRLLSTEAEAIEKVTGQTFAEWGGALMKGSATAARALVWVLRKRTEPTLRYRDVDFPVEDLVLDFDPEERAKIRAELQRNPDLDEDERRQLLDALGEDDLEQWAAEATEDGPGNVPAETGSAAGSA